MSIHCAEAEQDIWRESQTAKNIWKNRRPSLGRRKTDADLAEIGDISRVPSGQKRIRERTEGNSVIEEAITTPDYSGVRWGRQPREAGARRNVVRVGCNRFQKLQVVAQTQIHGQLSNLPSIRPAHKYLRSGSSAQMTELLNVCVKPELLYVPLRNVASEEKE